MPEHQTLNAGWVVSIARNIFDPPEPPWPLVLLHSPGLTYAFDSSSTGLDSPDAAMDMLTALGLHPMASTYAEPPEGLGWTVQLNRYDDEFYDSRLLGPYPVAPIGPLARYAIPGYWLTAARKRDWWCQLMVVSGVDLRTAGWSEVPEVLEAAAAAGRVAGATIRVVP
jgi:hypothetical protein